MSTIKLEIEVSAENAQLVADFLSNIGGIAKKSVGFAQKVEEVAVVDAEEVKAPAPAKTPTPRPSRAKPKPAPIEEEIEDEDEDEEFETGQEGEGDLDDEEEAITDDDIRALQATKIDKHRPAIAAHYGKLGAKGISTLAPENFQKMFDFLSKLK